MTSPIPTLLPDSTRSEYDWFSVNPAHITLYPTPEPKPGDNSPTPGKDQFRSPDGHARQLPRPSPPSG